jgi:FKBP-type peptidyl-prolyl cis-trans isomerase 2
MVLWRLIPIYPKDIHTFSHQMRAFARQNLDATTSASTSTSSSSSILRRRQPTRRASSFHRALPARKAFRTRVRASSSASSGNDDVSREDAGPDAFSGSILQDVRKGQEGFTTEMRIKNSGGNDGGAMDSASKQVPKLGDIVEITFSLRTSEGQILQDEDEADPVTFEVGAADVVGNPLFKAFDKAVRNMTINETREIEASGGEYDPNLLFRVPIEHPEIERLREVWAEKGGLQEGGTVTLMNGNPAVIRSMTDEVVMLDANHPFAGSDILFDLTLRDIRANE